MSKINFKTPLKDTVDKSMSVVTNDLGKEVKEFKRKNGSLGTLVLYSFALLAIFMTVLLIRKSISVGASAVANQYEQSKNEVENVIYKDFYEAAEKKYHVSNRTAINLGSVEKISKLEVFKVIESACVTQTDEEEAKGIKLWTKYRGEGIFTVDLSLAEYLKDDDNHYLLIRVPAPEMTEFGLIENDTERLLYAYTALFKDGNYHEGTELSISADKRGYIAIKDGIASNNEYVEKAKDATRNQLINLIKLLNMKDEMKDLVIEVEFFD